LYFVGNIVFAEYYDIIETVEAVVDVVADKMSVAVAVAVDFDFVFDFGFGSEIGNDVAFLAIKWLRKEKKIGIRHFTVFYIEAEFEVKPDSCCNCDLSFAIAETETYLGYN